MVLHNRLMFSSLQATALDLTGLGIIRRLERNLEVSAHRISAHQPLPPRHTELVDIIAHRYGVYVLEQVSLDWTKELDLRGTEYIIRLVLDVLRTSYHVSLSSTVPCTRLIAQFLFAWIEGHGTYPTTPVEFTLPHRTGVLGN